MSTRAGMIDTDTLRDAITTARNAIVGAQTALSPSPVEPDGIYWIYADTWEAQRDGWNVFAIRDAKAVLVASLADVFRSFGSGETFSDRHRWRPGRHDAGKLAAILDSISEEEIATPPFDVLEPTPIDDFPQVPSPKGRGTQHQFPTDDLANVRANSVEHFTWEATIGLLVLLQVNGPHPETFSEPTEYAAEVQFIHDPVNGADVHKAIKLAMQFQGADGNSQDLDATVNWHFEGPGYQWRSDGQTSTDYVGVNSPVELFGTQYWSNCVFELTLTCDFNLTTHPGVNPLDENGNPRFDPDGNLIQGELPTVVTALAARPYHSTWIADNPAFGFDRIETLDMSDFAIGAIDNGKQLEVRRALDRQGTDGTESELSIVSTVATVTHSEYVPHGMRKIVDEEGTWIWTLFRNEALPPLADALSKVLSIRDCFREFGSGSQSQARGE